MSRVVVYAICNHATGEAYIGQARSVTDRWKAHRNLLQRGAHHNPALQAAWHRYGAGAFGLIRLEYCHTPGWAFNTWALLQEKRWLARARAAGIVLYNDQVRKGRRKAA